MNPTPRDVIADVRQHDFCCAPRCARSLWGERGPQHVGYMTAHHDRLLKVGQSFVAGVRDFRSARQQFWQRWAPCLRLHTNPGPSSLLPPCPTSSFLFAVLSAPRFLRAPPFLRLLSSPFQLPSPLPFLSPSSPLPLFPAPLSPALLCPLLPLHLALSYCVGVINRRSFVALWDAGTR